MTPEQPPSSSRQPRPGRDARRRALGADAPVAPAVPVRESLRESLARIPDLQGDEPAALIPSGAAAPAADPIADPAAEALAPGALVGAGAVAAAAATSTVGPNGTNGVAGDPPNTVSGQLRVAFTSPTPAPESVAAATVEPAADEPLPAAVARTSGGRPKPPMWRRVAFAVVLIGLVAAIPVLGYAGSQLIADSKDGTFNTGSLTPTDPGYEAQVDPTPTAVAIQFNDEGQPTGLTFMALSGPNGGGSVIFVPLDTQVTEPSYGVNKLRTAYEYAADRPALARERLASQTGRLLNVGVEEIIDLGNEGWAQLVAPVGPLVIDNPTATDLGFGIVIPEGEATLNPDQVGRFLEVTNPGETDLERLERHKAVWSAWLDQVAASGQTEAVPGESSAGISRFAQALAKGPVSYSTLPVTVADDTPNLYRIDKSEVNDLITNSVAAPTAAVPGSRFTVRLLNGVSPDAIPSDLVRQVVSRGGAVTILGNGPSFDTDETTVVYANPKKKQLAELIAKSLGATGKVRLDREAPDTVDLTIVLGKDILGEATGSGEPGATTPETTALGGD